VSTYFSEEKGMGGRVEKVCGWWFGRVGDLGLELGGLVKRGISVWVVVI
jgi:hypothetical protein